VLRRAVQREQSPAGQPETLSAGVGEPRETVRPGGMQDGQQRALIGGSQVRPRRRHGVTLEAEAQRRFGEERRQRMAVYAC
jgi:hypothetical protein